MRIVVDSSVAACWALPDEFSALANRVLDEVIMGGMIVPTVFRYEIRNVLVINERRKRIALEQTHTVLTKLDEICHDGELPVDSALMVRLARKHALTAYDAAYLALSIAERAALATLDRKLAAAAASEGVSVIA